MQVGRLEPDDKADSIGSLRLVDVKEEERTARGSLLAGIGKEHSAW